MPIPIRSMMINYYNLHDTSNRHCFVIEQHDDEWKIYEGPEPTSMTSVRSDNVTYMPQVETIIVQLRDTRVLVVPYGPLTNIRPCVVDLHVYEQAIAEHFFTSQDLVKYLDFQGAFPAEAVAKFLLHTNWFVNNPTQCSHFTLYDAKLSNIQYA